MKRICVFCGSSEGSRPEYRVAAGEMAAELVRRNIGLVYSQRRPAILSRIELRTPPLHKLIELLPLQQFIEPLIKRMS